MTCTIMQPTYLPWVGGFDLIDQVDLYSFYDDVQVVKRSWDVRNRIKTANGELFLTIPIKKLFHRDKTYFNNAIIDDSEKWRQKCISTIEMNYRKSSYFDDVFPFVQSLILNEYSTLADFNINIIVSIARKLGIKTEFVRTSMLDGIDGKKDERLLSVCKRLNANTYLSPFGASQYIEEKNTSGAFLDSGVALFYHKYHPIEYKQLYGEFLSHMCILDLLFNEGENNSLDIIRKGRQTSLTSEEIKVKHNYE